MTAERDGDRASVGRSESEYERVQSGNATADWDYDVFTRESDPQMTSSSSAGSAFAGARATLESTAGSVTYYRLRSLLDQGFANVERLPITVKILLENLLRNVGNGVVRESEVQALARWAPATT